MRQGRSQLFEGGEYAANGGGQDHDIAALHRLPYVCISAIDGAAAERCVQHLGPVAAYDRSLEVLLTKGESKRAADQAGSYNRDLPNRHCYWIVARKPGRWMLRANFSHPIVRPTAGAIMRS